MTNVTNIYIDTTGFTDEQYALASEALDVLKSNGDTGWPVGDDSPIFKEYPVLCLDDEGSRHYQNDIDEMKQDDMTCHCNPVTLRELEGMRVCKKYGRPFDLSSVKLIVNDKPVESDGMTPEKERDIVCAVISGLYSARLISVDAYRAIINSVVGYAGVNDTQHQAMLQADA